MKASAKKQASSKQTNEPFDYEFDEMMIRSRQKMLKNFLQTSIKNKAVTQYESMKFKGVQYKLGDFLELWDISFNKSSIVKLLKIVQVPPHLEKMPFILVEWCLRKYDLPVDVQYAFGKHISIAEVFPSSIKYCLPIESIKGKCQIVSFEEYGQMTTTLENYFYTRSKYDQETRKLIPGPEEWKKACSCGAPENPDLPYVQCGSCDNWYHIECIKNFKEDRSYTCEDCNVFLSYQSTH